MICTGATGGQLSIPKLASSARQTRGRLSQR
ncbi:MAG: hypothetical protein QOI69_455, partial [Pseudonocardiales bacterium]|nr:hypothetical protein [Pseudonocardiales bacterium]